MSEPTGTPGHYERLCEMFLEDGLSSEYLMELDALVRDLRPEPDLRGEVVVDLDGTRYPFQQSQPDASEGVGVRPQGPLTSGNPSVGTAPSEASVPAMSPELGAGRGRETLVASPGESDDPDDVAPRPQPRPKPERPKPRGAQNQDPFDPAWRMEEIAEEALDSFPASEPEAS